MLWLAWRQHRIQIVAMLGLAIAIAVAAIVIGAYAERLRTELGVDTCLQLPTMNYPCAAALEGQWRSALEPWRYLPVAFYLGPALVASFIGGPLLAREFERGTHRLAWTQGTPGPTPAASRPRSETRSSTTSVMSPATTTTTARSQTPIRQTRLSTSRRL